MNESARTVFLLHSASYEELLHAGLLAVTAAAAGDEVHAMFFFAALEALAHGGLESTAPHDAAVRARRLALKLPSIDDLFAQARELGARVYVCDTHVRLAGVDLAALTPRIDEVISLPTFWKLTRGSRVVVL